MRFDPHQRARFLIDEARAAGIAQDDSLWLRSHTSECLECARHEETVDRILRGLNSFAFEYSPGLDARIQSALAAHARRGSRPWRWALAAAALLVIAAPPLYRSARDAQRESADALLVEGVEARVWRSVPVAMEPLMPTQKGESR